MGGAAATGDPTTVVVGTEGLLRGTDVIGIDVVIVVVVVQDFIGKSCASGSCDGLERAVVILILILVRRWDR